MADLLKDVDEGGGEVCEVCEVREQDAYGRVPALCYARFTHTPAPTSDAMAAMLKPWPEAVWRIPVAEDGSETCSHSLRSVVSACRHSIEAAWLGRWKPEYHQWMPAEFRRAAKASLMLTSRTVLPLEVILNIVRWLAKAWVEGPSGHDGACKCGCHSVRRQMENAIKKYGVSPSVGLLQVDVPAALQLGSHLRWQCFPEPSLVADRMCAGMA